MKVLLLNGSPRDGNTKFAVDLVGKTIGENIDGAEVDVVDIERLGISPCTGCNICIDNDGVCVFDDDMTDLIEKIRDADIIVFGSPVYWWGITAQLKAVIDRMYAMLGKPGKAEKKIGLIITGQDTLDGPQYGLISGQFKCISEYLKWDMVFDKAISADGPEDVKNNEEVVAELSQLWKKI